VIWFLVVILAWENSEGFQAVIETIGPFAEEVHCLNARNTLDELFLNEAVELRLECYEVPGDAGS